MPNHLTVAIQAAREAGKVLLQHYGHLNKVGYKQGTELVTVADKEAEKRILAILQKAFPGYNVNAEESGKQDKHSPYCWQIDPLDGTTNFVVQNPFFNTSIGLVYNNEPIVGVVFNPYTKELFAAEKGKGATMNGKKIAASHQPDIHRAVLGFCHPPGEKNILRAVPLYKKMKLITTKVRQFGSAALELCYVASGRIDAFYMTNLNPYDVAAGAVIAKEAGCRVTDFAGELFTTASRDILVSNQKLHKELLRVLQKG